MRGVRAMGVLLCAVVLGGCVETGAPTYSSPYGAYGGGYVGGPWYSSPYPYPYSSYGYWGGGSRWNRYDYGSPRPPPPAAPPAPRPPAPPPPPAGSSAAHNQQLLNQLGVRPN